MFMVCTEKKHLYSSVVVLLCLQVRKRQHLLSVDVNVQ